MKIKQILIHNFGKFNNEHFSFSPGMNVVYGENETGKSTLHTFLLAMLFGMEKSRGRAAKGDVYSKYEPWNAGNYYSGSMEFEVGGKSFHLERNLYHKEKSTSLYNTEDGEQLSVEYGDLQVLLGGMTKSVYENTCSISQAGAVTGKEMAVFVQNYMANATNTGEGNIELHRILSDLQNKKSKTAKEIKEETKDRTLKMEKLQMEREMLEEDISRIRKKNPPVQKETEKAKTVRHRISMCVLLLGCFLMAGWFLTAAILQYDMSMVMENSVLIGISTLIAAAIAYIAERFRPRRQEMCYEAEYPDEELQEKETRLFNVLECQTELEHPTERESELKQYESAYDIAYQTIKNLAGEIYEDFGDRINESASRILSQITEGRYRRINIDENMEVTVISKDKVCRPDQLSEGTLQQIYLAFRMSLGEIFSKEEPMPFLLDETFAFYDEKRTKQALYWLSRQEHQTILFTARRKEMEYLDEMGIAYQKIELEGN